MLRALGRQGFPVPAVLGLCTDDAVIGSWFYVMDLVEGRIFWVPSLPELPPTDRRAACDSMNETIARLHMIEPVAAELADYGRPGNYVERQVARFSEQYPGDAAAGRLAVMDRLIEWLPAHLPRQDGGRAIVHGIAGRVLRGNASHARAHEHVARFDPLAQAAWAQAQRAQAEA